MKWRELSVVFVVGALALSACSTTVSGSGTAGPTPTVSTVATTSAAAPSFVPPDTALGNPRTADLCSIMQPAKFAKYGDVSPTTMRAPTDCYFWITPADAESDIGLSAYVYGAAPFDPGGKGVRSRIDSGLDVYDYPFTDHYCRAMVGVAVGVETDDYAQHLAGLEVCAMRDTLAAQIAAGIAGHRLRHVTYGKTSLTTTNMCDYVDPTNLKGFKHATDMRLGSRAFGNECDLSNSTYWMDIWVGLEEPPVRPGPGGKRLTVQGHQFIQEYEATSTYCRVTSQQDLLPDGNYAEAVEASAELAPKRPADVPTGSALCSQVAARLMIMFLQTTGRK